MAASGQAVAAPGDLDTTFGTAGVVVEKVADDSMSSGYATRDVLVQPDGKIVVAGTVGSGSGRIGLLRLSSAGARDATFGGDGVVDAQNGMVWAVARQSDGRILVAAGLPTGGAILRFNADGSFDDGGAADSTPGDEFGQDGVAPSGTTALAQALAVQSDDRVVVAGGLSDGTLLVRRLDAGGAVDSTFGSAGTASIAIGGSSPVEVAGVVLDAAGRIVVAGRAAAPGWVVRLTGVGVVDAGFGTGGIVTDPEWASLRAVGAQGERPLIAGTRTGPGLYLGTRLSADGSPDSTFGVGGSFEAVVPVTVTFLGAYDISFDPDGRIVLGGTVGISSEPGEPIPGVRVRLARYDADGRADTGFGNCGIAQAQALGTGMTASEAHAIAMQPDGNIVAVAASAGFASGTAPSEFVVARLLGGTGTPVPQVGVTTGDVTALTPTSAVLHGHIDPNGKDFIFWGFDIGYDTSYGVYLSGEEFAGTAPRDVLLGIPQGLQGGRTYHYRLTAYGSCGRRVFGGDRTFTTPTTGGGRHARARLVVICARRPDAGAVGRGLEGHLRPRGYGDLCSSATARRADQGRQPARTYVRGWASVRLAHARRALGSASRPAADQDGSAPPDRRARITVRHVHGGGNPHGDGPLRRASQARVRQARAGAQEPHARRRASSRTTWPATAASPAARSDWPRDRRSAVQASDYRFAWRLQSSAPGRTTRSQVVPSERALDASGDARFRRGAVLVTRWWPGASRIAPSQRAWRSTWCCGRGCRAESGPPRGSPQQIARRAQCSGRLSVQECSDRDDLDHGQPDFWSSGWLAPSAEIEALLDSPVLHRPGPAAEQQLSSRAGYPLPSPSAVVAWRYGW